MIFLIALVAWAGETCRLGKDLTVGAKAPAACRITSVSQGEGPAEFTFVCGERLARWREGAARAEVVDPVSLARLNDCAVDGPRAAELAKRFREQARDLEQPVCHLEKRAGQMMFFTPEANGRCSFRMNQPAAEKFADVTHTRAVYQCERDYFLVRVESGELAIFQPQVGSGRWSRRCDAKMVLRQEFPDPNPPAYWQPPEPTIISNPGPETSFKTPGS